MIYMESTIDDYEQLIIHKAKIEGLIVALNERTSRKTAILKHELDKINTLLKTQCKHEWIIDTSDYNEHPKHFCKKCKLYEFETKLSK
jgi:hypothetical protein